MISWAILFLILALVSAYLGYAGLAILSAEIAKILRIAFVLLFILACTIQAIRGRTPPV